MDADVVVVGSGFGGSVAALRAAEKGYRVCVLEAGRRFGPDDFPRTSWNLRRFVFAPRLGLHGIQRLTLLGNHPNDLLDQRVPEEVFQFGRCLRQAYQLGAFQGG